MKKETTEEANKKAQKNVLSIGIFKFLNVIAESSIKAFGAVFIYINSGKLSYVFLYFIIYSIVQIISNISFSKLFIKNPKLSLVLRVIPFLLMYSIFFMNIPSIYFMLILSISNGLTNTFYFAPIDNISGSLKHSYSPKVQGVIQMLEYVGSIAFSILSGFVLDKFDPKIIAIIGMVIYLLTTIIFYFTYKQEVTKKEENLDNVEIVNNLVIDKESLEKEKFNPFKKYYPWVTEILMGSIAMLESMWRVYAYIEFDSFLTIGFMNAIIYSFSVIGTLIFVKLNNKEKKIKILGIVALIIVSILWIVRPYISNNIYIFYILAMLIGLLDPLFIIPLNTAFFKYHHKKEDRSKSLVKKDLYKKIIAIPVCLVYLISLSLPITISISGVFLGLGVFQLNAIEKKKK